MPARTKADPATTAKLLVVLLAAINFNLIQFREGLQDVLDLLATLNAES